MNDEEILVTYFDGDSYGFDWLKDDKDVEDWLEEFKDSYTKIEVLRVNVVEEIYISDDMK
ncbi:MULTISPECIES: hypothetical protein [unclassified Clostridium]|uniref:hypothetical protein n=1 Tax=unclassified Clostridium TaxID=2614128 RepID=UPI0025C1BF39|nr:MULTISPECIES: hypothetical protein [unclassified Clostridium]